MAERKVSYIAVGFLSPELEQTFSEMRKKVGLPYQIPVLQEDGKCNLIGKPHITIKRTFYLNEGITEEELIDRVKKVTFTTVPVSSNSWEVFETTHLGKVVVIKINKVNELVDLHTKLVDAVDDISQAKNPEYERDGFVPHASVTYWATDETIPQLEELIKDELPVNYPLHEIYLFRKDLTLKEDPTGPDIRELVLILKADK